MTCMLFLLSVNIYRTFTIVIIKDSWVCIISQPFSVFHICPCIERMPSVGLAVDVKTSLLVYSDVDPRCEGIYRLTTDGRNKSQIVHGTVFRLSTIVQRHGIVYL